MCGPDPDRDSTSLDMPAEDFSRTLGESIEGLRIGIPAEFFADGLAVDVRSTIDAALKEYEKLGAKLVPISLPRTEMAIAVYYIIAPAEASSNLSRFDGVKFGHRAQHYTDLTDMYQKTRAQGFGDEVKRRIMIGTYVLSHGYYDAYYLQAQKIRRMIADDFQRAFKECDVIAGPVAPTVAWKIGEKSADPLANYLAKRVCPLACNSLATTSLKRACSTRPTAFSKPPTFTTPSQRAFDMRDTVNTFEAQQQGRPTGPLVHGYEVIIGFETHAQLSTQSKIFSRAPTAFGAEPNTQACAVD
jgi:Asp-tRNA(Asn)/Glu-tRNA(Gln) amidotransferase A subunit family amidase